MPASAATSTRDRLLAAAEKVFAERGVLGATTREIAQAADLNEVTLFRHFQSKQRLLAAVIEHVFAAPAETSAGDAESRTLGQILENFASTYERRLRRNFALIRVLVGEIQHCDEQEMRVVKEVFRPQREELIEALGAAQARGEARADFSPIVAADQLAGLIFSGVLRCNLPLTREYSAERYLEECVATMLRALRP